MLGNSGREMAHKELGQKTLSNLMKDCEAWCVLVSLLTFDARFGDAAQTALAFMPP